jgi:hypothetical protein
MNAAARKGGTAMCEYLHAEHCPWSTYACSAAARSGSIDTLRWLREHGCPWNISMISDEVCVGIAMYDAAAEGGSVDALEYLQQQEGVVFSPRVLTLMLDLAGASNNIAAAQWLSQQGAEWPPELNVRYGPMWSQEALEWARAEGCTSGVYDWDI